MKLDLKKLSLTLSLTALGLVIGSIVSLLKLPVYLDTIGIMLCTLLLGWQYGILCSIFTAGLAFFIVSPYVPFYFGTMLGAVALTELLRRYNWYANFGKATVSGVLHGIIGTVLSAPVTYFLFHGFTASGNDLIVAFFVSKGLSLIVALLISLTSFAILDRILTSWFSYAVLKMLPKTFSEKNELRYYKD